VEADIVALADDGRLLAGRIRHARCLAVLDRIERAGAKFSMGNVSALDCFHVLEWVTLDRHVRCLNCAFHVRRVQCRTADTFDLFSVGDSLGAGCVLLIPSGKQFCTACHVLFCWFVNGFDAEQFGADRFQLDIQSLNLGVHYRSPLSRSCLRIEFI